MSRIQSILDKAERDGALHVMRGTEQAGPATIASVGGAPGITAPPLQIVESLGGSVLADDGLGESAAGLVDAQPPARVITGTRLDPRLVAASPNSVPAEQYRALRTRVLHSDTGTAVSVLLVTSPGRGEGKTITAGNLALTMARDYQRRICLVDADLRHPQLQRMFGLPNGPGLSDVLSGRATLDDALVTLEDHQLTILPAGVIPANPAELLGTTAMRRTIDTLRSRFDRVVVDSPAAAPLADVGILGPLVDSMLLVVRSSVTAKPAIHEAVSALDGSKLLGVVLNDAA
jgi:capsular exopolysaccharide synthesis family protein